MITTARLLTTPKRADGVRVAEAITTPGGQRVHVRVLPLTGGAYFPYKRGNTVLIGETHGDPDAGAYVLGRFTSPPIPKRGDNIEFHAATDFDVRLVAEGDGVIHLGTETAGSGEDQAFALIDKLREDLESAQQQIDTLVYYLNTAANGGGLVLPAGGSPGGAWTVVMAAGAVAGYIPSGPETPPTKSKLPTAEAAHNVTARPEDPLP